MTPVHRDTRPGDKKKTRTPTADRPSVDTNTKTKRPQAYKDTCTQWQQTRWLKKTRPPTAVRPFVDTISKTNRPQARKVHNDTSKNRPSTAVRQSIDTISKTKRSQAFKNTKNNETSQELRTCDIHQVSTDSCASDLWVVASAHDSCQCQRWWCDWNRCWFVRRAHAFLNV